MVQNFTSSPKLDCVAFDFRDLCLILQRTNSEASCCHGQLAETKNNPNLPVSLVIMTHKPLCAGIWHWGVSSRSFNPVCWWGAPWIGLVCPAHHIDAPVRCKEYGGWVNTTDLLLCPSSVSWRHYPAEKCAMKSLFHERVNMVCNDALVGVKNTSKWMAEPHINTY